MAADAAQPAIKQLQQDIQPSAARHPPRPFTTMEHHAANETSTQVARPATSTKDIVLQQKQAARQAKAHQRSLELEAARRDAQRARLKAVNKERQQFLSTMDRSTVPCGSPVLPQQEELPEQTSDEPKDEKGSSGPQEEIEETNEAGSFEVTGSSGDALEEELPAASIVYYTKLDWACT